MTSLLRIAVAILALVVVATAAVAAVTLGGFWSAAAVVVSAVAGVALGLALVGR